MRTCKRPVVEFQFRQHLSTIKLEVADNEVALGRSLIVLPLAGEAAIATRQIIAETRRFMG